MDPAYARQYRTLHERHWWWRAREAVVLRTLERLAPPSGWGAILDVGCGDALLFDQLSRFGGFVEGVEPDASLLNDENPWRSRVHVRPFDSSFDTGRRYGLVLMLDVLEHLDAPEAALGHALALLEPGGRILINVPAFNAVWTSHDDLNGHVTRYTKASFGRLAAGAGLHVDDWRYLFHWTWPVKLAQRVVERAGRRDPVPAGVPPEWVNRGLLALSRAEHALLGPLRLPFGTSLFVIGRAR
jgi:SAM-dependent methyltransferase